ncbi:hypothetical protein K474DRAFT_1706758 [Panus rudis PR-1116 ss-1]|nr:hypothetical protein K474DRAFT_1706758 [Panus rudis PR-1116 ss-1]
MRQVWTLFNISGGQNLSMSQGRLKQILLIPDYHVLVRYLARPTGYKKELTWRKSPPYKAGEAEHRKQLGALSRLPDEILIMIFKTFIQRSEEEDHLWGLYTLAVTNSYLAEIAYEVVQRHFMWMSQQWEGHRLICVGSRAEVKDLPPRVFYPHEVAVMDQYDNELTEYLYGKCPDDDSKSHIDGYDLNKAPRSLGLRELRRGSDDLAKCLEDLSLFRVVYDAPPQDWILANTTAMEFVRFDAIVNLQDCLDRVTTGPFLDTKYQAFGLGHVILSRICWSSAGSDMRTDGLSYELHRGPWAGHRFTIITRDTLGRGEGWKDISEQVVKDMEVLARGYYGRNWRKCVKQKRPPPRSIPVDPRYRF